MDSIINYSITLFHIDLHHMIQGLFQEGRTRIQQSAITLLYRAIIPFFGVQIKVKGNLPSNGPYILAANHTSHIDTPILYSLLNKRQQQGCQIAASQSYFFKNKNVGNFLATTLFPLIPVGRTAASLCHTIKRLKRDKAPLLIYPEGTRSRDGETAAFRSGVGLLASRSGISVIPVTISGAWNLMPKGKFLPSPGNIYVTIHDEISPVGSSPHEITQAVESAVVGG